jgi:hypothetical protein
MDLTRQLISFVGALLILIAYAGHQMGWMNARRPAYNILNAAGSVILWWIAIHPFQAASSCSKARGRSSAFGHWRGRVLPDIP